MRAACLDVANMKNPISMTDQQLLMELHILRYNFKDLEEELSKRTGKTRFAFWWEGQLHIYDFFGQAVDAAEEHYGDPNAGREVFPVFR